MISPQKPAFSIHRSASIALAALLVIGLGAFLATRASADASQMSGTVQFDAATYTVFEGIGYATVTVTRTGDLSEEASVTVSTSNGTALDGQDYTAVSQTLFWSAGDTVAKTVNIPITPDNGIEPNETFSVSLSSPVGAVIGSPSTTVVTILDDDSMPAISIADVSQPEGDTTHPLPVMISLSAPFNQTVSVRYSTENGTATAGSDYAEVTNGIVTFNPGETQKFLALTILGDFVIEPDETFLVNLSNPVNALIEDSQAAITLLNDDSSGTLQFSAANYSVNENAGTVTVTVTRTGGLAQGVSIRLLTVDGTALAGADYLSIRPTLIFDPGQTSASVTIPILNDNIHEPVETFLVALDGVTGGAVIGSPAVATVAIVDDDPAPSITISDVTQAEGNSGTTPFVFTVSLSGASTSEITLTYETANGTAIAPTDYMAIAQGTLTFDPGQTVKTITVLVNGDFDAESNETFFVNLRDPIGGVLGDGQGVGTIVNDDGGAGTFRFTASDYSVSETAGSITIAVQRTGGLGPASVQYSTSNMTAIAGQDYFPVSGTLNFEGGQTTATFTVPITNDGIVEPTETFMVVLSNVVGTGGTLGTPNTATVFITDGGSGGGGSEARFDYDGDRRSDLSVWRPSNQVWYLLRTAAGFTGFGWGLPGDHITPADYDGDAKTDLAVFRPLTGTWYIVNSSNMTFSTFTWGEDGDMPIGGDHNGDHKADLGIFRPSNNTWYFRSTVAGPFEVKQFGETGDKPVVGDFDSDGRIDIAVFRPSNSTWYILRTTAGLLVRGWGAAGDIPTPADFDGDRQTDLALFRPSTGEWYILGSTAGWRIVRWGVAGDVPVPDDYDGDGRADAAVFRPSNSTWYVMNSNTGLQVTQFGVAGDIPTQSAYIY